LVGQIRRATLRWCSAGCGGVSGKREERSRRSAVSSRSRRGGVREVHDERLARLEERRGEALKASTEVRSWSSINETTTVWGRFG
jgi:hypothetical protein